MDRFQPSLRTIGTGFTAIVIDTETLTEHECSILGNVGTLSDERIANELAINTARRANERGYHIKPVVNEIKNRITPLADQVFTRYGIMPGEYRKSG